MGVTAPRRRAWRPGTACSAGLLCAAVVALAGAPARADLSDDAERIRKTWSDEGARASRLAPIFLEHGAARAIAVEPAPPGDEGCTTIAVIGGRVIDFELDLHPESGGVSLGKPMSPHGIDPDSREEDGLLRSVAGAAVISRCGKERADLAQLAVQMRSPRAALEIIVARGARAVTDMQVILPERASGPAAPRGDPGRQGEPGPLADRVARAERRARLEGAEKVTRFAGRSSAMGTGQFAVKLAEGCHRLDVMAEVPQVVPRRVTDVDAEAREAESDRLITRDRAEAADARLDLCVGETTMVDVPFMGAGGATQVTLSDALWALPVAVPIHWGPRARGGFAWALRRRKMPEPKSAPIFESIGVQGVTSMPIVIEPSTCYLAAVAMIRGESRGVRLAAEVGDRAPHDEVSDRPEGAALAFCSESESHALLEVEMRGGSPWWALALWQVGPGPEATSAPGRDAAKPTSSGNPAKPTLGGDAAKPRPNRDAASPSPGKKSP